MNPLRTNTVAMNTVTGPRVMGCHCGHGLNVGIPGQQLVHQSIPMQHMGHCAHRLNVGISGRQLVPIQHVRHTEAVLQQQLVPMQHVQYLRQQQPTVVVGVNPCHQMQMVHMQPGMVMGSVAAAPMLTTTTTTTTMMMPAHYCQSSLAMVQMPISVVGVPQMVSSVAVPVPGQVLGEVAVVGV